MEGIVWVVLAGATLLTLLFSIVHAALQNPSRIRLEAAFTGPGNGERLKNLDRLLPELLLTASIVRTVCHLLLALAVLRVMGMPESWAGGLGAVGVAAIVVTVFGVALPQAWARYAGERTLALAWPVLTAALFVFWPITKMLHALDLPVRRLSGHHEAENGKTTDVEQEILQLASEAQADGDVDPDEMEMIESVIEFHDIRVGEIMTPRTDISALSQETSRADCVAAIVRIGHSRIPVYEESLDKIVGVLYAKDLLPVPDSEDFDLRKVMRAPFFVPETKVLSDLLDQFRTQKVHMAIVLDEYGGTAGLVTIEDLLEEIVGEITDEYESAEPEQLKRIDPRTVEVDARMYVDDINDELHISLPEEEDYDTVGGFVFSTLGYIPTVGEEFEHAGVQFTVLEAEQRKINRIRIQTEEIDN